MRPAWGRPLKSRAAVGRMAATLVTVFGLGPVPIIAGAQELHVDRGSARLVRFVSQAPFEDFDGITEGIDGFVVLPNGLTVGNSPPGSRLYLEVDLASIETGISLRDRHMRDNYLHTGDFPYATFSAVLERVEEPAPGLFRVSATGTLSIHGLERARTLDCETSDADPPHHVRCSFTVNLTDHGISIPRLMFMKIADEVEVQLEFSLVEPG